VTAAEACTWSPAELARRMASGHGFEPARIAGSIYRGTSLGLPRWVERLTWKKFAKAFAADGTSGWNIRIEQDGVDRCVLYRSLGQTASGAPDDRPWRPRQRRGAPITFGRFAVVVDHGQVVLDYRAGGGLLAPLRDPLVALDDRADTLLGRSLLAFGRRRIPTPSYFLLERDPGLGPA
jgi:hypothetical protein